jgi:hypothetical protein
VQRAEKFANAVDKVAENVGVSPQKILAEEATQKEIKKVAAFEPEKQKQVFQAVENKEVKNIKEPCYLCKRSLNTWIKTSIHLDGSEKPCILCFDCAKEIIKDIDKNSTEHETKELLQDVREFPALRKCKENSFFKKYFKFLLFN